MYSNGSTNEKGTGRQKTICKQMRECAITYWHFMFMAILELADNPPTMGNALRCRHITIKLSLDFNCPGQKQGGNISFASTILILSLFQGRRCSGVPKTAQRVPDARWVTKLLGIGQGPEDLTRSYKHFISAVYGPFSKQFEMLPMTVYNVFWYAVSSVFRGRWSFKPSRLCSLVSPHASGGAATGSSATGGSSGKRLCSSLV